MPTPTEFIDQIYIELTQGDIMGSYTHIQTKYMDNLLHVDVDDSLSQPDMFMLRFLDPGLEMLQAEVFKPGTKVKISVQKETSKEGPAGRVLLMRGEVTAIEPELNSTERSILQVRGYDLSHKMNRVRRTMTYQNVSDSDLASRLARGSGLQAQVTATSVVYPYLMQVNQTDWEFLMERAQRIGYRLNVEGKTLYFEPPPTAPATTTTLRWGIELSEFRARMSTIEQPSQVTVRGWDPKSKQEIVGQATSPTPNLLTRKDQGSTGGSSAMSAHSLQGQTMVVDMPIYSQSEATKIAQSLLNKSSSGYVQAEGVTGGDPNVKAGNGVDIDGIGTRFGGSYLVVRALHRYNAKQYTTNFWVSGGMGSMGITEILSANGHGPSAGSGDKPTARGVMVGIVTNNNDPENLGRVKVKIPALGDNIESYWCRMASIMAGPGQGVAYLPEANDEVVVAFQNGDPNHAYVLGAVWNGNDKLPMPLAKLVSGGKTIRRVSRSRVGHEITLDDSPDPTEGIIIIDKTTNNFIKIVTKKNKIEIQAQQDIVVTSTTGNISATATTGNIKAEAPAGKISAICMGDIELTSSAGKLKVNATGGVEITSAGQVSITAATQVSVRAPMINLN